MKRKRVRVRDVICERVRIVEGPGDMWVLIVRGKLVAKTDKVKGSTVVHTRRRKRASSQ